MTTNGAGDHFALSQEQREQFDRDGYLGPVQIYEPEEMEERWRTVRRQLVDRSHAIYSTDSRSSATNIANYDRHLDVDLLSPSTS